MIDCNIFVLPSPKCFHTSHQKHLNENLLGFLVMGFDNSLSDTAAPIGTFSEIVEGTPAITPANYLNCLSGSKVKSNFIHTFHLIKLVLVILFEI